MIEYINAGGDYLGLNNLDKIKCPDCNRAYLQKSKFHSSLLLCPDCGLSIDERDLNRESKYVPLVGQMGKPFDNQHAANSKVVDPGEKQAFVIDSGNDLDSISFKTLDDTKRRTGAEVQSQKHLSPEKEQVVKDLVRKLGPGKDVKVALT